MSESAALFCYGCFFIITMWTLRGLGYGWVRIVFAGLISPVAFLVLFTMLGLPMNLLAGTLHLSEQDLPGVWITAAAATLAIAIWGWGGFLLVRRRRREERP